LTKPIKLPWLFYILAKAILEISSTGSIRAETKDLLETIVERTGY
jgi:hypothetical protein